jgi:hypothetical protein
MNQYHFAYTDGTKLPPICIFKGKRMNRGENIPSGVVVYFQKNGWMDTQLMDKYIDYFNDNRPNAPTLLVYDSFRGHLEESIKEKFHKSNVNLAVIPGGLTSICQPLDVAINKPFKDNIRKEWHLWMANGGAGTTSGGNLKRARYGDVCNWVKHAWENISNETITNSFVTCNIVDSLDELDSEDELIISDIGSVDDNDDERDDECDDDDDERDDDDDERDDERDDDDDERDSDDDDDKSHDGQDV